MTRESTARESDAVRAPVVSTTGFVQKYGAAEAAAGESAVHGLTPDALAEAASCRVIGIQYPVGAQASSLLVALHRARDATGPAILVESGIVGTDAVLETLATRSIAPGTTVFLTGLAAGSLPERRHLESLVTRVRATSAALLVLGGSHALVLPVPVDLMLTVKSLQERRAASEACLQAWLATHRQAPILDQDARQYLAERPWPGDVSELFSTLEDLARDFGFEPISRDQLESRLEPAAGVPSLDQSLADLERDHIYRVLDHNNWNRTQSAKTLGIDVKTLYNKLKRYGSDDQDPQRTATRSQSS
ncbi:MAG: hypothetical protein KDB53_16375 [Planctomycetes bacterium]|nr:hypothetical protein [Planctomycetota bacterium]